MENNPILSSALNESRPLSCPPVTPLPLKKRLHASVSNLSSQKRRRLSSTSVDLVRGYDENIPSSSSRPASGNVDRFLSNRPKTHVPLSVTPRTRRMSQQLGLIDDKVLSFGDHDETASHDIQNDKTLKLLRRSASTLFEKIPTAHPTSVSENLEKRKTCLSVLDCPGVPSDLDAYPIAWSSQNLIAVVCGFEIFFQNNETKAVSLLGRSGYVNLNAIQWGGEGFETWLASGDKLGIVRLWDAHSSATTRTPLRTWTTPESDAIKSQSWYRGILAIGDDSGDVTLIDSRSPGLVAKNSKQISPVVGLQWNHDGRLLASGDKSGIVYVWDCRAGKPLFDTSGTPTKLRHRGSARALSWCPWKQDLLATGTTSPEGKIRIWSTSTFNTEVPTPISTIPLNTSITSLIWSPHCKELLSTQGSSFTPILQSRSQNTPNRTAKVKNTKTPLANSIVVHQYPSGKRLMTLPTAHSNAISHSCLSPNGEEVYTLCPREENIKLWKVWSAPAPAARRESAFDKFSIR